MKTKTILIGSLLLLMTLFAASLLVIQTTATVVDVDVRITPTTLSEEDGAPSEFRVTVKVPASSGYTPADIDPEKVAVEGIPMKPVEDWPKVTKSFFAFKVDGPILYNFIWNKVGHVDPGTKATVDVTVTGSFKDSTDDFAGTCTITFMTMHLSPPPPP